MSRLGEVRLKGFDNEGYERRERLDHIAECPDCGKEIECWAETECWTEDGERWKHSWYGGAMGVCEDCEVLIADCLSDGFQCFNLSKEGK
jgi:hypothetical protein